MRRGIITGVLLLIGSIIPIASAAAQTTPDLDNKMIEVQYVEPTNPGLRPIYERFKKREILESLKRFLSPLKLDVKLRITALQCDDTNAYWAGRARGLLLCYEYADWVERLAPTSTTPEGYTHNDTVAGEFIETALHELGHAAFDLFDVPVFGREEDAADQMSGFLMLQFGKEVAVRTINGTAAAYQAQAQQRTLSRTSFSDEHGTDEQRFYNYLCLAYGADPEAFQRFVDNNLLPRTRAVHCRQEYNQVKNAFAKTIFPHIDRERMKQVQSMEWLKPDDGRD